MFETLQDAIKHYAKCMKCSPSEAKEDAEREITLMMEKEGYSREFAEATWMEEQEELDCAELDKMGKEAILNALSSGEKMTITDLMKAVPELGELSNQRVSAIVRQLTLSGEVVRTEDKRKAFFSLAD